MTEHDTWQERYLAIVPEKLTVADVKTLLDLIDEDARRFLDALEAFAETVSCECSPITNPGCQLGDHSSGHLVAATWRVSQVDHYDEFVQLCTPCKESFAKRPEAAEFRFQPVEEDASAR